MVDVAQCTEHTAKYAVLRASLPHAECQLKAPPESQRELKWEGETLGVLRLGNERMTKKSQLSDLCSIAKHSHTHTKHQTSPTTGWCPNVTQKRKKELRLSDWGEVNK